MGSEGLVLKRSSKKGRETELPWEGAYRKKHFKGLLSRLISMLVALPGCRWVIVGGGGIKFCVGVL